MGSAGIAERQPPRYDHWNEENAELTDQTERTLPVKPGDWVARKGDPSRVARVKAVEYDRHANEVIVDLVLYARDGKKTGRESPAMGGPRTYEPSCSYSSWERVEKPEFPLTLKWMPNGDGTSSGGYSGPKTLPDREWVRPAGLRAPTAAKARTSDFDPETEASARRMAAQELRDVARKHGLAELTERAERLEEEAEAISPRAPR